MQRTLLLLPPCQAPCISDPMGERRLIPKDDSGNHRPGTLSCEPDKLPEVLTKKQNKALELSAMTRHNYSLHSKAVWLGPTDLLQKGKETQGICSGSQRLVEQNH